MTNGAPTYSKVVGLSLKKYIQVVVSNEIKINKHIYKLKKQSNFFGIFFSETAARVHLT